MGFFLCQRTVIWESGVLLLPKGKVCGGVLQTFQFWDPKAAGVVYLLQSLGTWIRSNLCAWTKDTSREKKLHQSAVLQTF